MLHGALVLNATTMSLLQTECNTISQGTTYFKRNYKSAWKHLPEIMLISEFSLRISISLHAPVLRSALLQFHRYLPVNAFFLPVI